MAKKTKENLQPEPRITASVEGDAVILKSDDNVIRIPLTQPGPAKPQMIAALDEDDFLAVRRLIALGIDDLDKIAKILRLDRATIRASYGEGLRSYSNPNSVESGLQALFEKHGDYCQHSLEFRPLELTGLYPDKIIEMRKQRPALFRNIPDVYAAKRLVQEKGIEGAAKKLLFDLADFQRWLKDHEELLSKL